MGTTKEPALLQRFLRVAALYLLCNALAGLTCAQDITTDPPPPPRPKTSLDLSKLGYEPSSRMTRLVYKGTVVLGFVDANHILFTFDPRRLFQRAHDCPPTHDDWLAHAAIMELPSGKIIKETDWYLHDRRRYLWPLRSGQFLLRRLNSLYLVDRNLETKLLLTSDRDLLWVSVTPDRQQIIVETPAPPESGQAQKKKPAFRIDVMDSTTLESERTFELGVPVALEATSSGYPDALHQNALWMIRFGPNPSARHNVARVRTLVEPLVFFSSNHSMVIARCPKVPCQFSLTSFTTGGKRLWRQQWKRERHFPAVSHSESNSRFAVSTLTVADEPLRPANPGPNDIPVDVNNLEGLEQCVDVLETASGTPVLSVTLSPAVLSGQNVALSPDGSRLAVVNGTALEVYDLPPVTVEEEAQFTAIKADAPGLYVLTSKSDNSANVQEKPDDPSASALTEDPAEALKSSYPPDRQPATDPARPSTASKIPQDIPSFTAASRAVLLDIVVTNDKGEPVTGLSAKDFEVAEDGKPQSLQYFNEVTSHSLPPETSPPASNPKTSPNVFTNTIRSSPTRAVNLVLLDLLNTPVSDQIYARQQLMRYIRNKPTEAQFALAVLTPGVAASLRLVQGFTDDENTLMAAANSSDALPKKTRWETSQSEALASTQGMVALARNDSHNNWAGVLQSMQEMQAQVEAANTDERVGITLEALSHLARYLSGYPGRKSLIWLSGSFPMAISPGAAANLRITENRNYFLKVKQATNLFAEGQIAVYPVDVRGLIETGTSAMDSDFTGSAPIQQRQGLGRSASPNIGVRGSNRDFTPGLDEILDLQRNAAASIPEDHNTMNQFASDTGGQAFFNTNAIEKAVAVAMEQGSKYYSLSYSPTNKNYNGKFRKINVTTAEKGYHLHYRRGYYATDDSSLLVTGDASSGIGSAAMQHGSPLTAQVHFAVRVVPLGQKRKVEANPDKGKRSKRAPVIREVQHYGVDYAIDSSDLRFLAGKEGQHLELGIEVVTFAGDGRLLNSLSGIWSDDLKPSTLKDIVAGGVRIHQEIEVPLQAASLRLGVQDRTSSHLGTLELPLPVPAPPDIPRLKRSLPEVEPD